MRSVTVTEEMETVSGILVVKLERRESHPRFHFRLMIKSIFKNLRLRYLYRHHLNMDRNSGRAFVNTAMKLLPS